MNLANIITITNRSKNAVVFKPSYTEEKDVQEDDKLINPDSFRLLDYKKRDLQIDMDEMYFQFENDEKKIKIEEAYKYGVYIEYQLL